MTLADSRTCPDEIRTPRLLLRRWREADLAPFRALNADPEVMRFFARPLEARESDKVAVRLSGFFDSAGVGPWAVELPGLSPFIGFVGCWPTRPQLPFAPAIEVGWRLHKAGWGQGYAAEAASAAIADLFGRLGTEEVVAYTATANAPSIQVMRKLGMERDAAGDFEHPLVPAGHPMRPMVLYRLARSSLMTPARGSR